MMSVIMLSVIMLSVIMLKVVRLGVVAPFLGHRLIRFFVISGPRFSGVTHTRNTSFSS
jgi:hypothetical protein